MPPLNASSDMPIYEGNLDQIPLTKQSIHPLQDIGASGSLNRLPIFPDDLYPVLALGYALDPSGQPRTLRLEKNQALDVYVTNSSGGGGGGGAVPAKSYDTPFALSTTNTTQSSTIFGGPTGSSTLYGGKVTVNPDFFAADTNDSINMHLYLHGQTSGAVLCLVQTSFTWTAATDAGHMPQVHDLDFGPGFLLSGTFSAGETLELMANGYSFATFHYNVILYYTP